MAGQLVINWRPRAAAHSDATADDTFCNNHSWTTTPNMVVQLIVDWIGQLIKFCPSAKIPEALKCLIAEAEQTKVANGFTTIVTWGDIKDCLPKK